MAGASVLEQASASPGTVSGCARPCATPAQVPKTDEIGVLMRQQELQEAVYDEAVDYEIGSPHLTHRKLRRRLVGRVRQTVNDLQQAGLPLTVLEIGAGHGGYTEPALAMGCEVTAVEMSRPALEHLSQLYATNSKLTCVVDAEGDLSEVDSTFSLVMAASVLHHIPDYLAFLERACDHLSPGGSLLSFQDPVWYDRVTRAARLGDTGAYYLWRLTQPDRFQAVRTFSRRIRKVYDETNPSDMVEYHVARNGVDEEAIRNLLSPRFRAVEIFTYWSNQSRNAQLLGERLGLVNTFGVSATGYLGATQP
jgi:2-polyprenyl-3-methyl-5-hydroxy-6-metoxy-1,4-benzoquinol methylase